MSKHSSLKHLFSRINIPNNLINEYLSKNKNKKVNTNKDINTYDFRAKTDSNFSGSKNHKSENYSSKLNKSLNINYLQSKLKGYNRRINSFNKQSKKEKNKISTNMTQTPSLINNQKSSRKLLLNSISNRYHSMKIKKNDFQKENNVLSFYKRNNYKKSKNKNNICINSNINKTLNNNVIVDNNIDLLREIRFQTVNNFNNKYKLKFKTKFPKIHNKIDNIFSMMKLYKYEEEKKMDAIITFANEKPKINKKKMKSNEILFNEKDFQKNFFLYEKNFDIKSRLKDNKKYVSIHTLNLIKE